MFYILKPNIALRGWRLVPHAYYVYGAGNARSVSSEAFEILRLCDGKTEISPSPLLTQLVERGLCLPAQKGEQLSDWQKYRFCDNRYFPAVNWAITGKCNFNCRHCFNAADNAPLNSEFTWEQCLNFIQELDECGVQNVTLTGGEPMLHPYFMDICKEILKRGMEITELTTNGSLITREMLDEFERLDCRPLFKMSLDGIGHHDWFRNKSGAEKDVFLKIEMLKSKGFKIKLQTNIHRGNLDTIIPTIMKADELSVDQIRLIRTTEAPRWAKMGGNLCLSMDEYFDFSLDIVQAVISENVKMDIDIWQVISIYPKYKQFHHRAKEGGAHKYRASLPVCRSARGQIAVTPEGNVLPCNQMSGYFKKIGKIFENVHETPLRQILSSGEYLDSVCYNVGNLLEKNAKCQNCAFWRLCLGGCRAIGIVLGGSFESYDPSKCLYFDEYFHKFSALFDENWSCIDDIELEGVKK